MREALLGFSKGAVEDTRVDTSTLFRRCSCVSNFVDKHHTARMFSALSSTSHSQWHEFLFISRSTTVVHDICDRKVMSHSCSHWKVTSCAFPHRHLHLAHLRFAHRGHHTLRFWLTRCTTLMCNKLHTLLDVNTDLRTCTTRTCVVSLALLPKQHAPQVLSLTSVTMEVEQIVCPSRTPMMKI